MRQTKEQRTFRWYLEFVYYGNIIGFPLLTFSLLERNVMFTAISTIYLFTNILSYIGYVFFTNWKEKMPTSYNPINQVMELHIGMSMNKQKIITMTGKTILDARRINKPILFYTWHSSQQNIVAKFGDNIVVTRPTISEWIHIVYPIMIFILYFKFNKVWGFWRMKKYILFTDHIDDRILEKYERRYSKFKQESKSLNFKTIKLFCFQIFCISFWLGLTWWVGVTYIPKLIISIY
ncbi:hypothetical protein ACFYU8_18325 [Brevibacillus sp. NPDC003359]|uniref:hypothetical protein n=1 Tax=unclassified Brevibacillus TaxID=2684853 RepID=UPI00369EE138